MCGISAYLGNEDCFPYIINGLEKLQYRGYDSAGICSIDEKRRMICHKYASSDGSAMAEMTGVKKLRENEKDHKGCKIGIGHTRWATHGEKSDRNAHPHIDYSGRFAIVHNGTIENYQEIKNELIQKYDIQFRSQTDTEVMINLISVLYDKHRDVLTAIKNATQQLLGTWAVGILCADTPNIVYYATNGCPLLIGYGENIRMIVSQQMGFHPSIKNYIALKDGDVGCIALASESELKYELKSLSSFRECSAYSEVVEAPASYYTLKEIYEQVESASRCIASYLHFSDFSERDQRVKLDSVDSKKHLFTNAKHVLLLGCGTSYYAGCHGSHFFKDIANMDTVQALDGGEFTAADIPKSKQQTIMILLSQSGETKDLHRCLKIAKENKINTIGVINAIDSLIGREVDCQLYIQAGREIGVASTKSFTCQVISLACIALWFAQNCADGAIGAANAVRIREEYMHELLKVPNQIKMVIEDCEKQCREISQFFVDKASCFILGKGWCDSIAKEGALKIKEIGYIHAEGFSAVALKHGPFSLLQKNTPVIFLNPDDEHHARVKNAMEEVYSRNTPIILITDAIGADSASEYNKSHNTIIVPKNQIFKGILHVIPLQLIAYYLAIHKNINPDMPRNLAKCITVD